MRVEQTDKEIIIKVSSAKDLSGLDRILDYLKFWEIASKSEALPDEIESLAKESKSTWWEENKRRFVK